MRRSSALRAAAAAAVALAAVLTAAATAAVAAAAAAADGGAPHGAGCACGAPGADEEYRVLVLGAGVAGATVARSLAAAGVEDVLVLEAGAVVGGRLRQAPLGDIKVEVGANWVQGYTAENSMSDYINSTGLRGVPTDWDSLAIVRPGGEVVPDEVADPLWEQFEEALAATYRLAEELPTTQTVDVASALLATGGWEALDPVSVAIERFYIDYEYAVPAAELAVRGLAAMYRPDAAETVDYFVNDPRGFAHVVRRLLADAGIPDTASPPPNRLRLNTTVTDVAYGETGVCVTTADGRRFGADYAVSTFSVGVLQAALMTEAARPPGAITLTPPVPAAKRLAISSMKLADYGKVFARWDEPIFSETDPLFLLPTSCADDRWIDVHNLNHAGMLPGAHVLLLTATASYGRALTCQSANKTAEAIAEIVSSVAGRPVPPPTHVTLGQWYADPLFRGAYSAVPPGFGADDWAELNRPLGRLHFAGEAHALNGTNGFVQGSWESGMATAAAVVAAMKAEAA